VGEGSGKGGGIGINNLRELSFPSKGPVCFILVRRKRKKAGRKKKMGTS